MDTSWSAAPEISCAPAPGCGHADLGKLAALAVAGKRHFARRGPGPDPVRWSGLSAGARLRSGLAGFRCAAVAAGTELTQDVRQIPGAAALPATNPYRSRPRGPRRP